MKRKTDWFLLVWWILIFGITSIPGKSLPTSDIIGIDKVIHICMFAPLAFLLSKFLFHRGFYGIKLFGTVLLITILYSAADELHQPLVGRTCSIYDVLANVVGVLIILIPFSFKKKPEPVSAD